MLTRFFTLKGISKKIILSFSLLIFVILVLQLAASNYITQITVQNINKNYVTVSIKQKNEKLNKLLEEIDLFSKTIISNREIQKLLIEGEGNDNVNLTSVSQEISYAHSNTIQGVVLVSSRGDTYREAEIELGEYILSRMDDIKLKVSKSKGEMCFFDSKFINYGTNKHGDYFFLAARKIRDTDSFSDIGIMVVAVRESEIWKNFVMDGEVGDYYLVSDEGNIVSCREKDFIGTEIDKKFGKEFAKARLDSNDSSYVANGLVINMLSNEITNWKIVNVVPVEVLNSTYLSLQKTIIIIGITAIILSIYLSIIISGRITRPIRDMIANMKKVTAGNLNVQMDISTARDSSDELKELNDVFNKMTRELQYLIEKVYQESIREKEAELRALKAQINPHFLYNTLDTVYWMLIEKSDYDIAELVTKLGEILRYSIKKGSMNVLVREELQQVENYLFIQKARFENSLEYEIDVDDSILDLNMLSFLIQPFVENSINHGIMHSKGSGKVVIKGYRRGDSIFFEVIDDGSGMPQEQIGMLYRGSAEGKSTTGGIGIANVHERIKYYYGEEFGVKIESEEDIGTRVVVRIPILKSEVTGIEAENTAG